MSFTVKNLSYIHPNREVLFKNINFSVNSKQKVSIIGNNGSGKSTLFKILSGKLNPSEGEIIFSENPYYIPQHFGQYNHLSIAQALGIDQKLTALHQILEGDLSEENYTLLNEDWEIEEKARMALQYWELDSFTFSHPLAMMSGGEKTKVFLSAILIHSPDIILMDEPTNHLDVKSRNRLYEFIKNTNATLLIISHDRKLLNLLSATYELNKDRMDLYGGNYDFYEREIDKKMNALQNQLLEKEKELRKTKKLGRETLERQQKHQIRGEKQNIKKGIPKILMGNLKSKSEKNTAKLQDIHTNKEENVKQDLSVIKIKLAKSNHLKLDIQNTLLYEGKILIDAKKINFKYQNKYLWESPLSFQILSGDRLVIKGENGSGKTTLVKLILNQLQPSTGNIKRNDFKYIYIDQDYSLIDDNLSVYEQVQEYNSGKLQEHEIKTMLNRFLFTKDMWDKRNINLSGGEKMRLLLCCLQVDNNTPDMFILDEPNNNLDIQSSKILTTSLQNYQGTIVLISHDEFFIQEVKIDKSIYIET